MQQKLRSDGLVCFSVCLDDPGEKESATKADAFLAKVKADFDHFLLNEKLEDWQKQLGIIAVPAVFVFGRDGKLAKAYKTEVSADNPDGSVKYDRIEPFVKEQLQRKP